VNPAPLASRRQLEPREGVDRDRVRVDAGNVAADVAASVRAQERADTVAQPGQIVPGDWAPNREVHEIRTDSSPENHRRGTDEFAEQQRSKR